MTGHVSVHASGNWRWSFCQSRCTGMEDRRCLLKFFFAAFVNVSFVLFSSACSTRIPVILHNTYPLVATITKDR